MQNHHLSFSATLPVAPEAGWNTRRQIIFCTAAAVSWFAMVIYWAMFREWRLAVNKVKYARLQSPETGRVIPVGKHWFKEQAVISARLTSCANRRRCSLHLRAA